MDYRTVVIIIFCLNFLHIRVEANDISSCVEYASMNSPKIKKIRSEFNSFKERQNQSYSRLLPNIGLNVIRSQVRQERTDLGRPKINQTYLTESDSLYLNQPIFRPSLLKEYKKAKLDVLAEDLLVKKKEENFSFSVIEIYLTLIREFGGLDLVQKKIRLLERQKLAARKAILAGTGTKTEELEINAAYDKAQVELIISSQNVKRKKKDLSFLCSDFVEKITPEKINNNSLRILRKDNLEDWQVNAMRNNYEILSLKKRIEAARIGLEMFKFEKYPTLDLNLQISRGSSESTFFVNSETVSKSIGLSFEMPIYKGGGTKSKVRQAAFLLDAEHEGLEALEEEIEKNIQEYYFNMMESLRLKDAVLTAIESAKLELDANEKSARAGIRRQLDILISQQKLLSVENELINSKMAAILNWLGLKMTTGALNGEVIDTVETFFVKDD